MFGSTRRRATSAAIDTLRPLIGTIQRNHGISPHFWTDPYIAGFFNLLIGHHAKLVTRGKIQTEDLGRTLEDVLTALSNMNGAVLARRIIELAGQNDPDFNRGADDAAALCFYEMGILKNEANHPLVITRPKAKTSGRTEIIDIPR